MKIISISPDYSGYTGNKVTVLKNELEEICFSCLQNYLFCIIHSTQGYIFSAINHGNGSVLQLFILDTKRSLLDKNIAEFWDYISFYYIVKNLSCLDMEDI